MTTKTKAFIGIGAFLAISLAGYLWLENRIANIKENKALPKDIPSEITALFSRKNADDYPYKPKTIDWDNKFFLFDEYADLLYNKQRNEALGVHNNFPDEKVNGIILVRPDSNIIGYYKRDEDDPETGANAARQHFYVVSYFDLKSSSVLARDTIFGPLPKTYESSNQNGILPTASQPDEDELIETIQQRIK